jgi:hypothetical protein
MSSSPAVSPSAPRRALRALPEAIGGTRQDFTEGALGSAIALLAIPMVREMALESLFAVVMATTATVARRVGEKDLPRGHGAAWCLFGHRHS